MSFRCLRAINPNITDVDQLYEAERDDRNLYSGNGVPPLCSSSHPPPPSNCTVCFHQFVHVVCSNLLEQVALAMEGNSEQIRLIKSECPGHFATNENENQSGDGTGAWQWWLLLLLLLLPIMIVLLVAACRKCEKRNLVRARRAADSSA